MGTECLYDNGEEHWKTKLHVGCGGVYLCDETDDGTGYVNIDIAGQLADQDWKATENNATAIQDYYARLRGSMDSLPTARPTIVDIQSDYSALPYEPNSVDKIVCIQAIEHVSPGKGRQTLLHWWNILKPNGVLVVSVPDVPETIKLLPSLRTRGFGIRHLEGSAKDGNSRHISWYSKESIVETLSELGFVNIQILPNIHFYPAVVVRCQKGDPFVEDRSYQFPLPEYDASCTTVLDIGPGNYPLPFATRCFDKDEAFKDSWKVPCDIGDVYNLPYKDDEYSFVYASHILEHLEYPAKALQEMMRVGRRGYIEAPSVMVDYEMQHGAVHTRWMSTQAHNGIVMVEKSPDMTPHFTDTHVGNYMHRVTQYPIALSKDEQDIRMQFWRNQRVLNVSASWNKDTGKTARIIEVRLDGTVT